jgi:hypothetical protein
MQIASFNFNIVAWFSDNVYREPFSVRAILLVVVGGVSHGLWVALEEA